MTNADSKTESKGRVLVLGGTGKTGRRVAAGLEARWRPRPHRIRGATPPFDWNDESGWDACLQDVDAVYVTYAPDLAMPGATDAIQALVERARTHGVGRVVLLSGRGEPEAQACERIVQDSGLAWTVGAGQLVLPELLRGRLQRHGARRTHHAASR